MPCVGLFTAFVDTKVRGLIYTGWFKGVVLVAGLLTGANAVALGPVDGEFGVNWWGNQPEADADEGVLDAGSMPALNRRIISASI